MTHEQPKDGASHNNDSAPSSNNVDTISTNMNYMSISKEDNSVPKCTEFDTEAEIPSNKKELTSCAQKVGASDDDGVDLSGAHHRSQLNLGSSSKINADITSDKNCGLCGWGQTSKMCTSCEQKVEQANADDILESRDDKLFEEPPPKEDCPICMQPMPFAIGECGVEKVYMACCGKIVCLGCMAAAQDEMIKGNMKQWCAFCRVPHPKTKKEHLKRLKKRMKLNDAEAFYVLGNAYRDGSLGLPKDWKKALQLWKRAAELGSARAHYNVACSYLVGIGIEVDYIEADRYERLAAKGGHEIARYNLGIGERNRGNISQAMKHHMIAAKSGYDSSLKEVGIGFRAGHVTKDEYASTLRECL